MVTPSKKKTRRSGSRPYYSVKIIFAGVLLFAFFLSVSFLSASIESRQTQASVEDALLRSKRQMSNGVDVSVQREEEVRRVRENDVLPIPEEQVSEDEGAPWALKGQSLHLEEASAVEDDRKYIYFHRYGGRINNQWYNLVAALQIATLLNRTLLVPPESKPVHHTGMFDDTLQWWDLSQLYKKYSLEYQKEEVEVEERCKLSPREFLHLLPDLDISKWVDCKIIDIGGGTGLLYCQMHRFCGNAEQERLAYDIYKSFQPGPAIKKLLPKEHFRTSVHSRTHEGGPNAPFVGNGNVNIGLNGAARMASAHLKEYNLEEMQGHSYFNETLRGVKGRFLLASDGSLDWSGWEDQAVVASDAFRDLSVVGKSDGVFAALVELFSLVDADYFYGNIFSTFSLSVCMLRGEERARESNVCWIFMHPGSKFAEPDTPLNRIGCMVPLGNFSQSTYDAVKSTWGKRCDMLRFFIDPTFGDNRVNRYDVVELPMFRHFGDQMCSNKQPCKHVWEKVWRMWLHVGTNFIDRADFFLKVDPDAYLIPSNIRKFVRNLSPEDDLYTGHALYHTNPPIIAGAATLFSRGSIQKLANVYRSMPSEGAAFSNGRCVDRSGATEEVSTSVCAATVGIKATPARDEKDGEKILLFHPHAHLGMERTEENKNDWYWKGKPEGVGHGSTCCSDEPFAIHHLKKISEEQREIEQYLYSETEEIPIGAEKTNSLYENKVLQRDYYMRVREKLVDRVVLALVSAPGSGSDLMAIQVLMALFYTSCDSSDCVFSAKRTVSCMKNQTVDVALINRLTLDCEGLSEHEEWALHRQPLYSFGWDTSWSEMSTEKAQNEIEGLFKRTFSSIKPYRVVAVDRKAEEAVMSAGDDAKMSKELYQLHQSKLKERFGDDIHVVQYSDLTDVVKCQSALRYALGHWQLPIRSMALKRACYETQEGQMTSSVKEMVKTLRVIRKEDITEIKAA